MTSPTGAWDLPGLDRWLTDLAERLCRGLLLLPPLAGAPEGVVHALVARCRDLRDRRDIRCAAADCRPPAAILAAALDCPPTLDALVAPACDQRLAVLDLALDPAGPDAPWPTFLRRFAQARRAAPGLCILVPDRPPALAGGDLPCAGDWREGLSRGDRVIWAEKHLPHGRSGLAAELAVALAVELCAWRLDLAAELARAGLDDLTRPLAWLGRRRVEPAAEPGRWEACPLALYRAGEIRQLERRIWRAQLSVFFPMLEERRLELIDRHRKRLRIDEHLLSLGVNSVEEIELGALRFQLRSVLDRRDADRLDVLSRLRNRLAHRQPGAPEDCRAVLATAEPLPRPDPPRP